MTMDALWSNKTNLPFSSWDLRGKRIDHSMQVYFISQHEKNVKVSRVEAMPHVMTLEDASAIKVSKAMGKGVKVGMSITGSSVRSNYPHDDLLLYDTRCRRMQRKPAQMPPGCKLHKQAWVLFMSL